MIDPNKHMEVATQLHDEIVKNADLEQQITDLKAENERLHDLHLKRTKLTTQVINERDELKAENENIKTQFRCPGCLGDIDGGHGKHNHDQFKCDSCGELWELINVNEQAVTGDHNITRSLQAENERLEGEVGRLSNTRRRTDSGMLAECPMCESLDIGGASNTVHCYKCGLSITKPAPLQNAVNAWNTRNGKLLEHPTQEPSE